MLTLPRTLPLRRISVCHRRFPSRVHPSTSKCQNARAGKKRRGITLWVGRVFCRVPHVGGFGYHPAKMSVPRAQIARGGGRRGVRRSRIYRGCAVQREEGRGTLGEKRGTRGKMGFYDAPSPSCRPSFSPRSPPLQPRRQGRREAGARFYDDHGEGQGGAYVHHDDDTGKTRRGWGRTATGGREGGETRGFSHHSLADPRVPEARVECDLRPIREATPLTWLTMAHPWVRRALAEEISTPLLSWMRSGVPAAAATMPIKRRAGEIALAPRSLMRVNFKISPRISPTASSI